MLIKILEPDIKTADALEMDIVKVLIELAIVADVEKVHHMEKIKKYNIPQTPGLVINEKVKVFGRYPEKEEIKRWIQEELVPAGAIK